MLNDDAYVNSAYIPGGADYPERWEFAAREFRELEASLGRARLNQPYGPDPRQRYDLYYPSGRPEGLVVLIHGGYWLKFGREDFSHLARGATRAGWAVAMPSYRLAPEVPVAEITRDVAAAIAAASAQVAGPIAVTGHSAGGHLSLRMLCRDVDLSVRDRMVRCLAVSPLTDLAPFLETSMNADLRLDAASAAAESPALATDLAPVPVLVWVGGAERPAFLDQARRLDWPQARLHVEPGRHHFDVIEDYEDPESSLVRWLVGGPSPA